MASRKVSFLRLQFRKIVSSVFMRALNVNGHLQILCNFLFLINKMCVFEDTFAINSYLLLLFIKVETQYIVMKNVIITI